MPRDLSRSRSRSPSYRRRHSPSPRYSMRSRRDRSRSPYSSYSHSRRKSRSISPRRPKSHSSTPKRRSHTPRRYKRQRTRSPSLFPVHKSSSPSLGSIECKNDIEKLKKEEEKKRRHQEAELKLLEEESAKRVEAMIQRKVKESLNCEEVKLEIQKRLEEGRRRLHDEIEAQREKERAGGVKLLSNSVEEGSAQNQSPHTHSTSRSSSTSSRARESGVWGSGRAPNSPYSTSMSVNSQPRQQLSPNPGSETDNVHNESSSMVQSEEQLEWIKLAQVGRKKDFVHMERINGKPVNVLQGLELHTKVFNAEEQKKIVESVYDLQRMGQKGQLRERTYSEPRKWMRGKGRVTLQFGCCYNYAVDKNGNPPGIVREEDADPLPLVFKQMIKRLVRWHVLPPTCVPNSCIVNIYDEGDCIPPHIDHHDFLRPFCTVSFLAECNILFGANLKVVSAGEFSGPVSIPLPVGSVLILNGNGADVAKHCVPGVPAKRVSITFRRMDESKIPYNFRPDPELVGLSPIASSSTSLIRSLVQPNRQQPFRLLRMFSKT